MRGSAPTYLGALCKRGHDCGGGYSRRYESTRQCVECNYVVVLEWTRANRKKHQAYSLTHYRANRAECLARSKAYHQSPHGGARRRAYQKAHREDYNRRSREWSKTEKGRISDRLNQARRRARNPLEARHCVSTEAVKARMRLFNGQCAYCDKPATTLDHFIPVSKEGRTVADNLLPACVSCNCRKNNLPALQWFSKQPFFTSERLRAILTAVGPYLARCP